MGISLPSDRARVIPALLLLLLFAVIVAGQAVAVHNLYTTTVPGGNDFYPRWAGARALLTEGRNPYSDGVTREIEAVLNPEGQKTNSFNFAFPLPVIFLFFPLAWMDYAWAQAIWMVTIQWVLIALLAVLFVWRRWRPSPLAAGVITLGTLFSYPVVRTIFLGQFTLHVTLFLALSLLLLEHRRDGWAGVCLSLCAIKPQMMILAAPLILLWTLRQRRYRFVAGVLAGGGVQLMLGLLLLPSWPLDFVNGLFDYAAVAGGRNPLAVLLSRLWPAYPDALYLASVGVLLAAFAWRAWRDTGGGTARMYDALFWAMVVSLLALFQTGTTNHVILIIPLFVWLTREWRAHKMAAGLMCAAVFAALWWLFFATLVNAAESELMFLPLPFWALTVLLFHWVRRPAAETMVPAEQ